MAGTETCRRKCYYCMFESEDLQLCINHYVSNHGNCVLKLKTPAVDPKTGRKGYQTKNFNIIPQEILNVGEWLCVDEHDWTLTVLSAAHLEQSLHDMSLIEDEDATRSPFPKKLKCSTPKILATGRTDSEFSQVLLEISELVPGVLDALQQHGHLQTWLKLNKMISAGTFPFNNIAFLLFMDVCRYFSCDNTATMRYDERVKRFWRVGFRLFHGIWLRFMCGPKHLGHMLTSDNDSHIFQPSESMINFAVPVRSIASTELSPLYPLDIKPGLITYILDKIAEQSDTTKTYKLCLDGKKINASTAGKEGDIDLWGFEHEPTLSQRRAAFEQEKTVIQDLSSLLNNRLSVNQQFLSSMKHENVSFLKIELLNVVKNLSKRVKSLRETKVKRDLAKERLQKEAGEDWRKSKLVFVISGFMTTLYDIGSCIKMLLEVIDQICQIISVINHASYQMLT